MGPSRSTAEAGRRDGPLAGVRVLELGSFIAGPFAGRLLGDMGAEVIKVEPPGAARPAARVGQGALPGPLALVAGAVAEQEVRARSTCARARPGAAARARRHADVLIENFRPGTLERWNLGPDRLHEVNPGLVIARVSGYGQTGPYASRAGFASVSEAMGGIRHINGFPGEPPPRMHISLGDSLAGMFAAQGILAALYCRDATGGGKGQVVDVSLLEASFAMLESTVPEYDRLGIVRGPGGTGLTGRRAVEHLQVERRQVDGDRRERRRRLPPAVRGDGAARARRRRALLDPHRARRATRRRSRRSSPSGRGARTPPRSTRCSTTRA